MYRSYSLEIAIEERKDLCPKICQSFDSDPENSSDHGQQLKYNMACLSCNAIFSDNLWYTEYDFLCKFGENIVVQYGRI